MGKSAKKKVHWRKSSKKKKAKKRVRPTANKARHAKRRHRKRHPKSSVRSSHKRMFEEAETANYLLNQLLKTTSAEPEKPYHYHPRHHTKDPEFAFSTPERREFKQGFPASDTHFWRPQGAGMPPSRGNFPGWEPHWEHTYQHPHAV